MVHGGLYVLLSTVLEISVVGRKKASLIVIASNLCIADESIARLSCAFSYENEAGVLMNRIRSVSTPIQVPFIRNWRDEAALLPGF